MLSTRWEYAARMFSARPRRYRNPGHLARMLDPRAETSPALDLIDQALLDLMDPASEENALAVEMPPQEGKSQKCARRLPEWLLDHDPTLRIAIVSFEKDTALRWGRDIKNDITHHPCRAPATDRECAEACGGLHITIRRDSSAAGSWETPAGGGVYCVGIGGALAGRPVDVLIVDDPVKDRADAESETIRNSTWDWWESVALARLGETSRVVLITTRWHEDDLAGRIAARPSVLRWRKLTIPAIAETSGGADPLGRKPGEELPSVRHRRAGYFHHLRATMSSYVFSGLYQQKPVAPEGNFFRRQTFRYWREMEPWTDGRQRIDLEGTEVTLADCWRFATMDPAGSVKDKADYTVISAWAVSMTGDLILLDRVRKRVEEHDHFSLLPPLQRRWRFDQVYVEQSYYSKTFVKDAINAGVAVAPLIADTDKVTRAIPAAGRVHARKVFFPAVTSGCSCGGPCSGSGGQWLDEWCDELAIFPQGTHDDQVDTLSYAARIVVAEWTPARTPPRQDPEPWERAIADAYHASTGNGHGELDIMNVPY